MNMEDPALSLEQSIARQVHAQEHGTREPVISLEKTIARQIHTLHDAAAANGPRRSTSETEDLKRALSGLKVLEKGPKNSTIEHAAGRLSMNNNNDNLSGSSQHKFSEALKNLSNAQKALASPDSAKYTMKDNSANSHHNNHNEMDRSSSHRRRELSQRVCLGGSASSFGMDGSLQEQLAHGAGDDAAKYSLAVLDKLKGVHSTRRSTDPGCSYSSFDLHNLSTGDNLILEEGERGELSDVDIDEDSFGEEDNGNVGIDDTTEVGKEKGAESPGKKHSREARDRKKRMLETRKKREQGRGHEHAGIEKKYSSGSKEKSDRVERTKRGGRRASTATAGATGHAFHKAATTGGSGRGRRHDRTRDVAGKQLQQRMALIVPVKEEEVVNDIVEEPVKEDTSEDIARRAQIDALKKQALARGSSVSTAIANKIRNDPALLEKFLLEVHEEEELRNELTGKKGPPSVINGVDCAKTEVRRGLGEKADGKRNVRASNRSSLKTSSAIELGTYRSVIGSSSEH